MSIRVQDPLFLLSAQTGLSVGELQAKAASGNPDVEKPQEAKTQRGKLSSAEVARLKRLIEE